MPTSFAPPSHAPPSSGATNAQFIAPTTGDVLLFDALKQEAINVIPAHRSPLSCLALSADGKLLATASDKGTIIRVFSVPDAQKLFQFRRGTYPSRIYSMAFNATNTLLCVSSATDTVHIFRLSASPNPPPPNRPDSPIERGRLRDSSPAIQSIASTTTTQDPSPSPDTPSRKHNGSFGSIIRRSSQTLGKSFAQSVGGYLPTAVTEMWEPARDFAYCKIPKSALAQSPGPGGAPLQQQTLGGAPLRSVVAISSSSPQVMVVTSEGLFYVFNVDMEAGGEGVLCKQYSLVEEMGSLGDE
ncbi:MAG: autophagy protein [Vezdaea acicularis]|nr:MAG: autophagy protein [Vezdaea acicularis]